MNAIACSRCGTPSSGGKFCKKCGNALGAAAAPPQPPLRQAPPPVQQQHRPHQQMQQRPPQQPQHGYAPQQGQAAAQLSGALGMQIHAPRAGWEGLSKRWIVIPLAIYAFLANGIAVPQAKTMIAIAVVAGIGVGLWWLRNNPMPPSAPAALRMLQPFSPYAPALMLPVIFVALGGSPFSVALVVVGVGALVKYRYALLDMLEPWWVAQQSIPEGWRKPLAFVVPAVFGWYFGTNAGGREWTYTLISVSVGCALAFLILFTPPESLRKGRRPA